MNEVNKLLFDELIALNLPRDQYVIVASGPLGIRGLREMKDVDILVSDPLWAELSEIYEITFDHEAFKIKVSPNIEAFCASSFGPSLTGSPTAIQQITESELIEGLPFQDLNTALFFKKRGCREKDKKDVELIEAWLRENA